MNPLVDEFIAKANLWQAEMELLRSIVLQCNVTEELKWKQPCYTFQNKNILIISAFKSHCVLSFLKGVLLQDEHNLLVKPGDNSQSVKFFKFTSINEIKKAKAIITAYVYEAIEIENAGLKVAKADNNTIVFIEELQNKLDSDKKFKEAFLQLTPGRQRGYNIFFSAAKQSQTKIQRIENSIERILSGKGLNDCICGLSKKMPQCDGSHKYVVK